MRKPLRPYEIADRILAALCDYEGRNDDEQRYLRETAVRLAKAALTNRGYNRLRNLLEDPDYTKSREFGKLIAKIKGHPDYNDLAIAEIQDKCKEIQRLRAAINASEDRNLSVVIHTSQSSSNATADKVYAILKEAAQQSDHSDDANAILAQLAEILKPHNPKTQGVMIAPASIIDIVQEKDVQIEDLGLSIRSYNALKKAGINKASQILRAMFNERLGKVRNFGKKSHDEVIQKVTALFGASVIEMLKASPWATEEY